MRRNNVLVILLIQDLDEYKNLLKPRLKTIVQAEDHEWFIVFVSKATTDSAVKLSKRVYSRIEGDFSSKKRERYLRPSLLNWKFVTATFFFSGSMI